MVLTARARRRAFNFAKAISIGLRSGLKGGRNEPSAHGANSLLGGGAFMGRQIVQDDDVARLESRSQLSLDVSFKNAPVHRRVHDEGGGQGVKAQAGDEGLRLPVSERDLRKPAQAA